MPVQNYNISSIGAGIYTSLSFLELQVIAGAGDGTATVQRTATANTLRGYMELRETSPTTAAGGRIQWTAKAPARAFGRIREFPNLGIPANIVNVPQYGQATSSQVTGQSDPPSLDFSFNYVPTQHAFIDTLRSSGASRWFRIRMSNADQTVAVGGAANASGGTDAAGTTGVILPYELVDADGTTTNYREFSDFWFLGSVASFEITPALTDSNQLKVSLTIDGQLAGPYAYTPNAAKGPAPTYALPA